MNAILEILKRLNPGFEKTTMYRVLEYVVLAVLLVGLWNDASEGLSNAKAARDEQIKGYAVQIGVLHSENEAQKADIENLRKWNAALTERITRLEDVAIKGHH